MDKLNGMKILLVDDNKRDLEMRHYVLDSLGYRCDVATDGDEAVKMVEKNPGLYLVAVVDFQMPKLTGEKVVKAIKRIAPHIKTIMYSGADNLDQVEMVAFQAGVDSFEVKEPTDVVKRTVSMIENVLSESEALSLQGNYHDNQQAIHRVFGDDYVGASSSMVRLALDIEKFAPKDFAVLIRGESGCGKDGIAQAVHKNSGRVGNFVPVNMAAITGSMAESELFGHKKGAFTGANEDRKGLFEEAHEGTIFLDEIGELSETIQAKLLRVLDSKEVKPVGSTRARHPNFRFVAATNADLEKKVEEGSFRADLYYRLKMVELNIPPLRERPEDLEPLAKYFLQKMNSGHEVRISAMAMKAIKSYAWPGNIRELRNIVEKACTNSEGIIFPQHLGAIKNSLTISKLSDSLKERLSHNDGNSLMPHGELQEKLKDIEKEHFRRALNTAKKNKQGKVVIEDAARRIDVKPQTFRDKIKALGLA